MNIKHPKRYHLIALLLPLGGCSSDQTPVGYSTDIEPLLHESCLSCHSHDNSRPAEGGFSVDSYVTVFQGGRSGPVIDHENPTDSVLLHIMNGEDERFRDDGDHYVTTSQAQRQRISKWVERGLYSD